MPLNLLAYFIINSKKNISSHTGPILNISSAFDIEVVDIINHSDNFDGDHFWYLKNKHGVSVAPGLYIYRVVEKETELEFIGKFAVVK